MKTTPLRPAIAMIELIFAMVIIGIVLLSAPMLVSTATKSVGVVLQQEAINQVSSRINMILTYPWDENNTQNNCIPPVLIVTGGDSELAPADANQTRRRGVPNLSDSRTFICNGTRFNATYPLGTEEAAVTSADDQDDFVGTSSLTLVASGSGNSDDYLDTSTVTIQTTINYADDNATYNSSSIVFAPVVNSGTSSTNIKRISVRLTSTSPNDPLKDKDITMRAFSCNVGGYDYYHKEL